MTADLRTERSAGRSRPRGLRHRVAGLLVAVAAVGAVWLVWRSAIDTTGLRFADQLSLDGAGVEGTGSAWGAHLWAFAEPVVSVVSITVIFGVLVVACGLALYRRRVALAVQLVLLVGGANLTSQYLKSHVTRPDLGLGDTFSDNSWTSGHTTAAASMSVALVLAVPRRFRPVAVVVGLLYTTTTGVGTMIGSWHRPSDVIGGLLVVLAWTGLVTALDGTLEPGRAPRAAATTVALLAGAAVATGAAAWVAIDRTLGLGVVQEPSRADLLVAFGGGSLAIVAVACLVFACLAGLLALADQDTSGPAALPAQG